MSDCVQEKKPVSIVITMGAETQLADMPSIKEETKLKSTVLCFSGVCLLCLLSQTSSMMNDFTLLRSII